MAEDEEIVDLHQTRVDNSAFQICKTRISGAATFAPGTGVRRNRLNVSTSSPEQLTNDMSVETDVNATLPSIKGAAQSTSS
jgi:hypothetical protein